MTGETSLISQNEFLRSPSDIEGRAHRHCQAIVILPVRNEAETLGSTLDALAAQVDTYGSPLPSESYEILLLLNNCTDGSEAVAQAWKQAHPDVALQILETELDQERAHAGTARRLLMDTAWQRFERRGGASGAILSTDSDTQVAQNWIVENLSALKRGADAVGGEIRLKKGHLDELPNGARTAYLNDRRYQRLVAELEDLLDPQPHDPWPKHSHHFGASLACTHQAYAAAGGLPAVRHLEDVAFVDALSRSGARLRHEPRVVVYTSSRLEGRAQVGLSGQLRRWQQMSEAGEEHRVPSASWLRHQITTSKRTRLPSARLRSSKAIGSTHPFFADGAFKPHHGNHPVFEVTSDPSAEKMFHGERCEEITKVNRDLIQAILEAKRAFNRQVSSREDASLELHA